MDFTRFAPMPLVDGHIHHPSWELAESLVAVMDEIGAVRANLVSVPDLQWINQNPALIHFKAHYPGRAYISGALNYTETLAGEDGAASGLAAQVRRLRDIGFDGLKLVEGKPTVRAMLGFAFDGPVYAQMWAALEEMGLPVVFHVADPEEFWDARACPDWARTQGWFYGGGGFPSKEALYREVDAVLDRHPQLRIVFAHFYFLSADLARASALLDRRPTVCLDLTPGVEMYLNFARNVNAARDFFIKYADRIIYGTDIGASAVTGVSRKNLDWAESIGRAWVVRSFLETDEPFSAPVGVGHWLGMGAEGFRGIALPTDVLESIYHRNIEQLLGTDPVPLARDVAVGELERLAGLIDARGGEPVPSPARAVAQQLDGQEVGGRHDD